MAILGITSTQPAGLTSVIPSVIYLQTNDTYATVTTTGYLTQAKQEGFSFSNTQMALVYTTDDGPVWLQVAITYSNASVLSTIVSLISSSAPGDVILPTIANHLIVSTNTTGTLANRTGTAINNGSLQAGLSGTAGTLISYPGTALKGSLIVAGVANTGNTNTTISNAAMGQASVVSIPDPGATTANFILSANASGQNITTGYLQINGGLLYAGSAGGGSFAGQLALYSATASKGSLAFQAANNSANYSALVTNASFGQSSTLTLPDPGAAAADFVLAPSALVNGNLVEASGTAGLVIDSGVPASSVSGAVTQLGQLYQTSVTLNASQVIAAYATPEVLIPAVAGKVAVIIAANVYTNSTGNTAFATGVAPIIQYGSTIHGAGTIAVGAGLVTGDIEAATSQVRTLGPAASAVYTGITDTAVTFSCTTAYTAGTGTTITFSLVYQLITATV